MRKGTGKEFATYDNKADLDKAKIVDGRVEFEDGCAKIPCNGTILNTMVMCSDRQSEQMCGGNFLMFALLLNFVFICDPAHCGWRALLEALVRSGFMAVASVAQLIYNIAYGPFQRSAFFNYLKDACADISASMKADDPLLVYFWPWIVQDLGWAEHNLDNKEGRTRFLELLLTFNVGNIKGPKCSTGRFYSFCSAHREWDNFYYTKLFVMTWVALRFGWATTVGDIFGNGSKATPRACAVDALTQPTGLICFELSQSC